MKYTTIIGLLLVALGVTAYFFGNSEIGELFGSKEFLIGLLFGAGIGMLLGGFLGWLYKKPYTSPKSKTENSVPPTGSHNV